MRFWFIAIIAAAMQMLLAGGAAAATARPNFLFVLIDDMGYRDLGCFGSTRTTTAECDRLAGEAVGSAGGADEFN
jgi:arylsulfatase A-like enzyme